MRAGTDNEGNLVVVVELKDSASKAVGEIHVAYAGDDDGWKELFGWTGRLDDVKRAVGFTAVLEAHIRYDAEDGITPKRNVTFIEAA